MKIDIIEVLKYDLYCSTEYTFFNLLNETFKLKNQNYTKSLCLLYLVLMDIKSRQYKPQLIALAVILHYSPLETSCYKLVNSSEEEIDPIQLYVSNQLKQQISVNLNNFIIRTLDLSMLI